jgi:predicted nucleic acid-binding protein
MIVISDTSPLNYLILIEYVHVLPELYGRVVIPQGVFDELQRPSTPDLVRGAQWSAIEKLAREAAGMRQTRGA